MVAKTKVATTSLAPTFLKYTPLLLAFIAFFLYANTIGNGYNMDDELVTRKHKFTSKGLSAVKDILTNPYYSDDMGYRYGYRPVVHLSFALEHQLFGENPHTSHFFNVLLFALCVYLFFRLLKLWTGEKGLTLAVVATAIFIFHPVHTEVVASIKNRDEILALLFGLLAGIAFFKNKGKPSFVDLLLSAGWFSLALLAKKSIYPLTIIFPLMLIVLYRISLKDVLLSSLFLVIPGVIIVAVFQPIHMFFLLVFPIVSVCILSFFVKNILGHGWREVSERYLSKILNLKVGFSLIIGTTVWGIYNESILWIAVAFAFVLYLAWRFSQEGIPFLSVWLSVVGFFIAEQLSYIAIILSTWYMVSSCFGKTKEKWLFIYLWVFANLSYVYLMYRLHGGIEINDISTGFLMLLLFFFLEKKVWLGRVLILMYLVLLILIGTGVSGYQYFIIFSVSLIVIREWFNHRLGKYSKYALVFSLSVLGFAFYVQSNISSFVGVDSKESMVEFVEKNEVGQQVQVYSTFQEGRKLEFAENTLTAPHTFSEKVGTGSVTLGEYLRLMIFPWELSFYYGYAKVETVGLANPWVWISLLFHLGLIILALWQIKKRPFVAIGIVWYMLCIGLFSNWVELVAGMVGERLAFTASAGFCIFVAAVVVWVKPNLNFKKLGWVEVVLGVVMIAFGFRTITRNTDWKDKLTLMGNDIKHLEHSAQANNLYALSLMQESFENKKLKPEQQFNMRKLAVTHFDKALQIWPEFFNAAYDKGRASILIGDYASAIDGFEKAVAIGPEAGFIDPYMQLSQLYEQTGNYNGYLVNAKKLLQIRNEAETYNMVAKGFYFTGRNDSAKQYLHEGMTLFPDDVSLRKNIAEIFRVESKQDSVDHYLK